MPPAEYFLTVRAQTVQFLGCCVLGLVLGALLDCFRLWRVILRPHALTVVLQDALYVMLCALALQCYAVSFAGGCIELWMPLGAALGLALYLVTLGALIMRLSKRIARAGDSLRAHFRRAARRVFRHGAKSSADTKDAPVIPQP